LRILVVKLRFKTSVVLIIGKFWCHCSLPNNLLKLEHNGEEITVKQALASIGQTPLNAKFFKENFRELGLVFYFAMFTTYSDLKIHSKLNIKIRIDVFSSQ